MHNHEVSTMIVHQSVIYITKRLSECEGRTPDAHYIAIQFCTLTQEDGTSAQHPKVAPSRALRLLERNITEFLWNDPDGNRRRPMVDRATLA